MKKHIARLSLLTLCAAAILAVPASSRAQATTNAPATAAQTPPVRKHTATPSATLPFHGTLTAVDTNAMTLTVGKRTFDMTSDTTITKDGKPATLADFAAGDSVAGSYKKDGDKLKVTTMHNAKKKKAE